MILIYSDLSYLVLLLLLYYSVLPHPVRLFVSYCLLLAVVVLNEDNFEELTQMNTGATTGRWFVKFYAPVFPFYFS